MRLRGWLRIVHLLGAASLGTLVYSPWITNETFLLFNQIVVIPALTASGLYMWLGHKLRGRRFADSASAK